MKSSHKLPFHFDVDRLKSELSKVITHWESHFNKMNYSGDWSGIPLRHPINRTHRLAATDFSANDFEDSPLLNELSYSNEVLATFKCPLSSVRFLRLGPGSIIKEHKDLDLSYFNQIVRIHIPIISNDKVEFILDGKKLKMLPGECWFGEFAKPHCVKNKGTTDRIHLVIDCEVNDWIRNLFIKEGIVLIDEKAPDPIDDQPDSIKIEMINSLMAMNNETSVKLANELMNKYGLERSFE